MAERIRFHLDEHVAHAVASGLRLRGIDVTTTAEKGMISATDLQHLEFAQAENRVLVTRDTDYLRLHESGVSHAGIAFIPAGRSLKQIIAGLQLIFYVLIPDEMHGRVEFL